MSPRLLLGVTLLLAHGLATPAPARAARQHVIVVGVNRSADPGVEPLRFADNDAARYTELLEPNAASLALLTVLDAESQERFPAVASRARPPTRADLRRAIGAAFAAIEEDESRGLEADLIFIYTGHGAVDAFGEGYVSLLDGPLTRTDLFVELVAPSPARFNHLVIDACSAYYLVNRSSETTRLVRDLLDRTTLRGHPNTGAILATSRDRATHEWTQVEGGVFSHEVLSALAGAADVDGDGTLRYAEVGAFVEAANQGIKNHRARVDLFLSPPQIQIERPLWRREHPAEVQLALAQEVTGRFAILDDRGVYVAELNKNAEQPIVVDLSGAAPFVVRTAQGERRTRRRAAGEVSLAQLKALVPSTRNKGAIEDALRQGIYTVPFGRSFVDGYRTRLLRDLGEEQTTESAVSSRVEGRADERPRIDPASLESIPTDREPAPRGWLVGLGGAGVLGLGIAAVSGGVTLLSWYQLEQGRMEITHGDAKGIAVQGNIALVALAAGGGLTAAAILGIAAVSLTDETPQEHRGSPHDARAPALAARP